MFPLDPSVGDIYENYEWNGTAWKFIGYEKINDYAPKDSPAITGVASLPSQTTIGVVNRIELEKLYGFSGQIASTEYVDNKVSDTLAGLTGGEVNFIQPTIDTPAGAIHMFGGLAAPFGYLLCDGSAVDRTAYASLFTAISTIYGAGNGTTTFNLPNLKGRVAIGADASQIAFDTVGETGGANTHQHIAGTSGNHDGHNHAIPAHGTNVGSINTSVGGAGDHGHNLTAHSHYSDHSHSVNPGSTATTSDSHSHGTAATGSTAIQATVGSAGGAPSRNHTHNTNSDSHSHTVNIATFTSGNSNYGNTAGANANTTSDGPGNHAHSVNTSAFNTSDGAGSHSHTTPASSTLSNLQPYIVVNYIIKT